MAGYHFAHIGYYWFGVNSIWNMAVELIIPNQIFILISDRIQKMHISTYITCSSKKEAEKIAETLVTEKLAACVNYFPVNSIYTWEGKVVKDSEYALLCKTRKENFNKIKKRVKEIHSYKVPAILALEIIDGNSDFLDWIDESVE